jgi:non-lysosomal glucosylceramidase
MAAVESFEAAPGVALATTMAGCVADLMRPGSARPFAQPWFESIPTSVLSDGMPMGGFGSAFSLTPAGTTPVMSFLPGYHLTAVDSPAVRLHNFFFSERIPPEPSQLYVDPSGEYIFTRRNDMYPLLDPQGRRWFTEGQSVESALACVRDMTAIPSLYPDNRERLERWGVPLSPRTARAIASSPGSVLSNLYLLLDFYASALTLRDHCARSLTADTDGPIVVDWETYPADCMQYRALYPVAETRYQHAEHHARILKRCYTALVPGEADACHLPVSFVEFVLHNPGPRAVQASLVQALENLCGSHVIKHRPGLQDGWMRLVRTARHHQQVRVDRDIAGGSLSGVLLGQREGSEGGDLRGHMFLGVWQSSADETICVTVNPAFAADREKQVIAEGLHSGRLSPAFDQSLYTGREGLSAAVCATVDLAPGASKTVTFVLGLDFPEIAFPGLVSRKSYVTRFPARERIVDMAAKACADQPRSAAAISRLQRSIERSQDLDWLYPDSASPQRARFVTLLTNLLGFYADAAFEDTAGNVLVRESADYPFFNVLDVYFFGVFSLQPLWPDADRAVLRRYAAAIFSADPTPRRYGHYTEEPHADLPDPRLEGPRAVHGAVPHDLGSPFDCRPDAYLWRNVKEWKDLAPKYVLLVLRSFQQSPDLDFLRACAPAVYAAIDFLGAKCAPGTSIPLAAGADDTFDNLGAHGITVYCGSLWIAGLRAAARIACLLGDTARAARWTGQAAEAQRDFSAALWDEAEGYYHFYATPLTVGDLRAGQESQISALLTQLNVLPAQDTATAVRQLNAILDADADPIVDPQSWKAARHWGDSHCPRSAGCWGEQGTPLRRARRTRRKLLFAALCPAAWTDRFHAKLLLDSDDVLAVQLLADTWLDLLDLEPITPVARRKRALTRIVAKNFRVHSPAVGAANLVSRTGGLIEDYQAQDVWLGIQFALAAALVSAEMRTEAREIIDVACVNLYDRARIPFAAPEGFNGTSPLDGDDIARELGFTREVAGRVLDALRTAGVIDESSRVVARIAAEDAAIHDAMNKVGLAVPEAAALLPRLRHLVESWTLRYSASRYHRPGMAFCILEVLRKRARTTAAATRRETPIFPGA